ncbi:hypothetical protein ACH4D4_04665 [Streptomyces pristinaespiralis]|uniref:hypothetical protein n=1 Tax=Streptomyces pristinaespiralis TaxID=38300 RepID=UPI0037B42654
MLDVTYEAVDDLAPGQLADVEEDRGRVRFRLDRTSPLADVVRQLNIELDRLLSAARWFQMWGSEFVSRNTPGCPLRVEYVLHPEMPRSIGVGIAEERGIVRVYISPDLDVEEFTASMNPISMGILEGGHWFQLYGGEIVDNSPEPANRV